MDSVAITLYLYYFDKIVHLEQHVFELFLCDFSNMTSKKAEFSSRKVFLWKSSKKKKTTEKKKEKKENAFIAFIHLMKEFSAS